MATGVRRIRNLIHQHHERACTRARRAVFSRTSLLFLLIITHIIATPAAANVEVLYATYGVNPGTPFSRPLGIFFDRNHDECYVADTGNHQIVVCDTNGMPLFRFYHYVETADGERTLGEPKSVVVDDRGRVFVTDGMVGNIDVLDQRGRSIARIEPPNDICDGRFDLLALAPDGRVFATLSCDPPRVVVINQELQIQQTISLRAPAAERHCITGICVDDANRIYVTDPCAPEMVQVYQTSGQYVMGFGRHDSGWENFSYPAGISVLENGELWIVDTIRQVASRFTPAGEFKAYLGGKGNMLGAFSYPSYLTTDGEDRVFVVERGGNRYQCFQFVDEE